MDAIIFDMDGTMWDAVDEIVHSWNTVLEAKNVDKVITRKEMQSCMGMLLEDIVDKMIPMVDEADKDQFRYEMCQYEQEYISKHGGKLYPGLEKTLEYLSGKYELYIVSNCQHGYIQSFFNAHGLEKYFQDFECAGSTGLNKMENILLLAHRNSLTSYAYVGDTLHDMEAAREAGAQAIYASYGFGQADSSKYDIEIESLEELMEIF